MMERFLLYMTASPVELARRFSESQATTLLDQLDWLSETPALLSDNRELLFRNSIPNKDVAGRLFYLKSQTTSDDLTF